MSLGALIRAEPEVFQRLQMYLAKLLDAVCPSTVLSSARPGEVLVWTHGNERKIIAQMW